RPPAGPAGETRRRWPGRDREDVRREDAGDLYQAHTRGERRAEGVLEEHRQGARPDSSAETDSDDVGKPMESLDPGLIRLVAARYQRMQGLAIMASAFWLLLNAAGFFLISEEWQ